MRPMRRAYSIRVPIDLEIMIEKKRAAMSAAIGFALTRQDAIVVLLRTACAHDIERKKK